MKSIVKKSLLSVALLLFFSVTSFAQAYLSNPKFGPDEETRRECAVNLSLYREYYNQRNYKMAKPSWLKVLEICPAASRNAYIHGARMYKTWIEEERNPNRKAELLDSLMMLYDKRIEHFGGRGSILGQKGMDMASIDSDRYEEAYEMLKESVEIEKENSDSPVLFTLMAITKTMYDNNKLPAETVIETYAKLADYLDMQISERPEDNRLLSVKESVDAIFSNAGVADCDNLTQIFEPRVDNNPEDLELIKKTHNLLSANRCENTDFYRKTLANLFNLEPTAQRAYELAKIFMGLKDFPKTEDYFKKAIELETDSIRKSVYLVEYASIVFDELKKPQQARSLALQAVSENPGMGHAYILIGNIYAAEKNCFSDEFEKKSVFWVAVDKFNQAKRVDPSLAAEADRLIGIYSSYFPPQNDIFFQDLEPGERFTVGCWINETTTIRARP